MTELLDTFFTESEREPLTIPTDPVQHLTLHPRSDPGEHLCPCDLLAGIQSQQFQDLPVLGHDVLLKIQAPKRTADLLIWGPVRCSGSSDAPRPRGSPRQSLMAAFQIRTGPTKLVRSVRHLNWRLGLRMEA